MAPRVALVEEVSRKEKPGGSGISRPEVIRLLSVLAGRIVADSLTRVGAGDGNTPIDPGLI